ncbi:bifunctional DNA primase/polymerase [Salinibacter ruber]|uniref:bifunctional DNA primase/polymerase n=2 Tax=Salinibacter ruber TaxID=146919 RepID=UPI0020747F4C|nr:bifunctional DNA primase/polymerase [Salinibacter ruber]
MKYPTDSITDAAAWLHEHGANVLPLNGKRVIGPWKQWQSERQSQEQTNGLQWGDATGVGVLSGIGDWRCLDVDGCESLGTILKILRGMGLPDNYRWVVKSGSGAGFHIWIRCPEDDAFGGRDDWVPADGQDFDHIEVRWANHQTAMPPSTHPDTGKEYIFPKMPPKDAPKEVSAEAVREGLRAVGTPKRERPSTTTPARDSDRAEYDDPNVETIRSALDALPEGLGESYNDWLHIIMAVKDGAPDDRVAEKLLKDWRSEWESGEYADKLQSLEEGTPQGVEPRTVGTLFATAKENGWSFPDPSTTAKKRVDAVVEQIEEEDAGAALIFEHLADFARLDTTDFAVAKDRISDVVNLNDFNQAVRQKRREVEQEDFQRQSERPTVQVSGRPGREVVDEAKEALHDWNDPPTLFQRGTEPAQIAVDDQGRPIIRELPEPVLDDRLDRAANFYRSTKKRGAVRADLSKRYVQRIRETIDLPPLDSIVEVPVLREDGSVLDEPGYDESSRLYYRPDESLDVPDVPDDPTGEEIERAKETIWKPLQDFPFVNQASKANALALMLTPIVRPQLGAQNVPLAVVDATVQGTGKTLLVNVVSLTATGRTAATMNAPDGDEEWRKQITAQLLQGASMIVVDNVRGRLQSAPLEQALTTALWQDRVLGKSQQVELPQRATWVATGNNVQPHGDMKRRVYPIRMDAEMERPWKGRDFSIDNLKKWTRQHRGELVAALLTLARGWQSAGRPEPDVELLGSFEEWTRTVGGILQYAGVEGFLDNLETLYEQTDEETAEWAGFLQSLYTYFHVENVQGNREDPTFTSKELGRLIQDSYNGNPDFRSEHMEDVIDHVPDYILQKLNRGDPISRTIGNMFAHRRGRRFGPEQWRVEVSTTKDRTKQWIVRGDPKKNESNESSNTPARENTPHPEGQGWGSSQKNGVDPDSVDSSEVPRDEPPF